MRAVSLLAVLLLAHVLTLSGHSVPLSPWTPLAFIWQDALLASVFACIDWALRRSWWSWVLYALIVLYVAVDVPLARTVSTPLTWTMARAARGPLADSIWHYVNWQNCALIALVLMSGMIWPVWNRINCRRRRRHDVWKGRSRSSTPPPVQTGSANLPGPWLAAILLGSLVLMIIGLYATRQVETMGLHRNPIVALLTSVFPQVTARGGQRAWRASPFVVSRPAEDLTQWRDSCFGRNVILVLLESTGAGYLHDFGAREDPTPNLTKLGAQSILFANAYAVYPESIKGLFSILCSQYPCFDSQPSEYARVRVPSLAQVLAANGYRTALFHSGRFMYLGMESIVRERGYASLEDAGDIGGNYQSSFGVDEPAAVQRIFCWLDAQSPGQKFFITYLPVAGHHPYHAPSGGPFPDADELGHYRNALHYGDAALGELLCGLRKRNLLDNTLLVFSGDHGEAFGQHEGNYGHTLFVYEENVHVPLLLVAPGVFDGQTRINRVASLIDITPTILDLLGIDAPPQYQGQSLLPAQQQLALFYTDYSLPLVALRDGPWKFIQNLDSGRWKLFDLSSDPAERTDLSARFPERTAAYGKLLRDWSAAQKKRLKAMTR